MHNLTASCHCGNLRAEVAFSRVPVELRPRVCDCDFCRKHGASYLADPQGTLHIQIKDAQKVTRYRQGSDIADCLVCSHCGVLVAICYEDADGYYGVVNTRALDGNVALGESQAVSPKLLTADEKVARWKQLWFSHVTIIQPS